MKFNVRVANRAVGAAWSSLPEPKGVAARDQVYHEVKASFEQHDAAGKPLTLRQDKTLARMVATQTCAPLPAGLRATSLALMILCIIYGILLSLNVLIVLSQPDLPIAVQIVVGLVILGMSVSIAIGGWSAHRSRQGAAYGGLVAITLLLLVFSLRALPALLAAGGGIAALGFLISVGLILTIQILARRARNLVSSDLTFFLGAPRRNGSGQWDFRSRAERRA